MRELFFASYANLGREGKRASGATRDQFVCAGPPGRLLPSGENGDTWNTVV